MLVYTGETPLIMVLSASVEPVNAQITFTLAPAEPLVMVPIRVLLTVPVKSKLLFPLVAPA